MRKQSLILALLMFASLAAQEIKPLLQAGDFESPSNEWVFWANGDADGSVAVAEKIGRDASKGLRVSNRSAFAPDVYVGARQTVKNLSPGTTYVLTLWARGESVGRVYFGTWSKQQLLPEGKLDWTQFTQELVADEKGEITVVIISESPTTDLDVDDVALTLKP